ncbi:MAG: MerR family transcriptional regulator [Oscillospiraceae bacterium]|nr:MerR family transcriptional regulator [Oscillospiraceae bacterium]
MRFTISEISELFKLPSSTIRYYLKNDLLPFMEKDEKGYFFVDQADITSVLLVHYLKYAGFSVKEIKDVVALTEESKTDLSNIDPFNDVLNSIDKRIDDIMLEQKNLINQLQTATYLRWLFESYVKSGGALPSGETDRKYNGSLPSDLISECPGEISAGDIVSSFFKKYPDDNGV